MSNRGGISLRPGDGIIHSWLNRMLLPDTVGTGGDSHTRFPIGISFPPAQVWWPLPQPPA
jgi:aconitate hydratase 2/2-methylisocitrate dehydratase